MSRIYNWKRDAHDERDYILTFSSYNQSNECVDLRKRMPPIFDQGNLGSCTANAIAGAFEYDEGTHVSLYPSRLFIYYNERNKEGTVDKDAGASLRDGIKTMAKIGACSEDLWPYDISKFTERPPQNCFDDAENHKIKRYSRLSQSLDQFKQCLEKGKPFIFGILVYESFNTPETEKTGIIPMPNTEDEQLLGGHAIVCVGYDDTAKYFIFRNSWGTTWGDDGYGYIPYDYLLSKELSSDFWVVEKISAPAIEQYRFCIIN